MANDLPSRVSLRVSSAAPSAKKKILPGYCDPPLPATRLGFSGGQYKTWTADCGLGIKYGIGIKRGHGKHRLGIKRGQV